MVAIWQEERGGVLEVLRGGVDMGGQYFERVEFVRNGVVLEKVLAGQLSGSTCKDGE